VTTNTTPAPGRIGAMYDRDWDPAGLPGYARAVEKLGLGELWVVEDLGWTGGVSAATAALAATTTLRVGIGICPAPLRNPALLAMELATMAELFPGRITLGVGHGVQEWMAQVGAATSHPLALLEETITAVRALLRGERVTLDGQTVRLDGVQLVHPPRQVPPVVTGVVRPRSLELSGRVADGAIIAEGHGPEDVRSALTLIPKGHADAGARQPHEVTVFSYLCVQSDPARLAAALGPATAGQAAWLGRHPEQLFHAAGSPFTAAARVRELWHAGASSVVLRPVGDEPLDQLAAAVGALEC
jgi:5,10-methylenetetrahydromethanopterin reductase